MWQDYIYILTHYNSKKEQLSKYSLFSLICIIYIPQRYVSLTSKIVKQNSFFLCFRSVHGTSKNSPNIGHPVPGDGRRDGPPFLPTGRSLSTSPPRRADPPAAGKLQLVAVGNRFCLARQDEASSARPGHQLSPADAVGKGERAAPGRGDSVDTRRAGGSAGWPAALRSRSSSDEGSIHRYYKKYCGTGSVS